MTVAIDWVSARVPLTGAGVITGGSVVALDADGVVEWRSTRRLEVKGSYSTKMLVRASGDDELEISGNPVKYLQGHNVFGPASLIPLVSCAMAAITDQLGVQPAADDRSDWRSGAYTLSRVDVARLIDCGSSARTRKVLDLLNEFARTKYQSASRVRSGTVYIGQHSRRVALKFYDKGEEVRQGKGGHGLCAKLAPIWHPKLLGFASGKLRAELTLRSNELRDRGLHRGSRWSADVAESLLDERMAALELHDTLRLADDVVEGLPGRLVAVYEAWRAGRDLRVLYARRTFYRYRNQLLAHGVDIAKVQPRLVVTENEYPLGVSLRELLTGPGVDVPDWARGTELLAS
jgi:II/X family phage/plasmid replication protein